MHAKTLVKRLIRIDKIAIEDISFEASKGENTMVVHGRPLSREAFRCPRCGKRCKGYDSYNKIRRWRSLDLGNTRVYIEAPSPRIKCEEHGVLVARVPWARHDSDYTYDFEMAVTWLALKTTANSVAECFRIKWDTVGSITRRVQKSMEEGLPNRFDGLIEIGIDETSYKKGHKYMTVIVNHKTGALIWAKKGHGKEVLTAFFKELTEEQRASIRLVTADGARWIADCIKDYCPKAERCIDPFHVVAWANEQLDEVRKQAVRDAKEEAAKQPETKAVKKKESSKITKYSLLKKPENLTQNQKAAIEMLVKSNKRLNRAYLLKEHLRLVFQCDYKGAVEALHKWLAWAQRCRIPEFLKLREKISRHKSAILSTIKHGLTNARIEAINNNIKVTIRMGYGYRNIENLISLVRLKCSGYDINLPGRNAKKVSMKT